MSALAQALPLALSAAVYPPALLVLVLLPVGKHPRRLVLAYFAGAAILTVGAGLLALALLNAAGLTTQDSSTASGWVYILVGLLLLVLASGRGGEKLATRARRRRGPERSGVVSPSGPGGRRQARMGVHPRPGDVPSIAAISAGGQGHRRRDSSSSNVLAVLICATGVMLFVEVPLVAMFVRPGGVAAGIKRFNNWLKRKG